MPLIELHCLSEDEWTRLIDSVPKMSADGLCFDERNDVYPCRIPFQPNAVSFDDWILSLLLLFKDQRVSLIVKEESDIHKAYLRDPGQYFYVFVVLKPKSKDGRVYYNLYCRDVLFVCEKMGKGGSGAGKKGK